MNRKTFHSFFNLLTAALLAFGMTNCASVKEAAPPAIPPTPAPRTDPTEEDPALKQKEEEIAALKQKLEKSEKLNDELSASSKPGEIKVDPTLNVVDIMPASTAKEILAKRSGFQGLLRGMNAEQLKTEDAINIRRSFASFECSIGNIKDAILEAEAGLQSSIDTLGDAHPYTAGILSELGTYYKENKELEKALDAMTKTVEALRTSVGTADPRTGLALYNLAGVDKSLKNTDDAINHYEEALKIFKDNNMMSNAGDSHFQLGIVYQEKKDYPNSELHYRGAFDYYLVLYGEANERTILALKRANLMKTK